MQVVSKRADGSKSVKLMFHDKEGKPLYVSKVKQSFKEECDINNIVNRFRRTGVLPPPPPDTLKYGDFSDVGTFQDAMIRAQEAKDMFMDIPAKIRAKFDNDVGKFLEYADAPHNYDELVELGLVDPKLTPKPNVDGEVDVKSADVVKESEQ